MHVECQIYHFLSFRYKLTVIQWATHPFTCCCHFTATAVIPLCRQNYYHDLSCYFHSWSCRGGPQQQQQQLSSLDCRHRHQPPPPRNKKPYDRFGSSSVPSVNLFNAVSLRKFDKLSLPSRPLILFSYSSLRKFQNDGSYWLKLNKDLFSRWIFLPFRYDFKCLLVSLP